VAIADRQTAVYPAVSPGGWNLIGRSPLRMFNADATPPMPVHVGDRVRFKAIDRDMFLAAGGEL
jgi:allophanate hydrolase subunit 1